VSEFKKKKLILIGGGDFTKKAIRLVSQFDEFEIIGYTDKIDKGSLLGIKYLGDDKNILHLKDEFSKLYAVMGIGGNPKFLNLRSKLINFYKNEEVEFPSFISKRAHVDENVEIGEGVLIFDNSYIDFNVKLLNYCVVNTAAVISHDCIIGNNTVISPGSVIGGGCTIDKDCFLGLNSTINPYLIINPNVIVGAGAMISKSLSISGIYVGNPFKRIK